MSHHLTVIINNGVLSTLLGVHIGSTRVALREREFQWHLPGIRWGGIISWALFSSCSFHPPLVIIAQYCVHHPLTKKKKKTKRKENDKLVGSFLKINKPCLQLPHEKGKCLAPPAEVHAGSWASKREILTVKMGLCKSCAFTENEKVVEAKHKDKKIIKQLLFSVFLLVPSEMTSLVVLCLESREVTSKKSKNC